MKEFLIGMEGTPLSQMITKHVWARAPWIPSLVEPSCQLAKT